MRERNGGTIVLGNWGKMEYAFTKYLLAYTIQYIIFTDTAGLDLGKQPGLRFTSVSVRNLILRSDFK